mmetsp:Transcript_39974/g.64852  ORF Transcript_39974/g.64852 Transcript_39974/m.64852 type:complete len:174 (+) Transcript_39974:130-651(+)|eukprot:CAMPEP_0184660788 /NCGR_PEP_ID=MMETSP0308-20130426/35307_1 /TAXON_ID=38269 /ORGANISM="Gloeochaete witrockiana, Strain SAG 46.84" /LENGTH=173 /DNA_ID=CAMNT_0027101631 /DNA_START=37 /DNA_END=558 /DNA_ORIENTATION=+
MAGQPTDPLPRDARVVSQILRSMGVEEADPRIINQFLDFMHRYVAEVLQDARDYADHCGRSLIDFDDLRLSIQSRVNFSFTQPPPRELLVELAKTKNTVALPIIPTRVGVHLPPDRYCLTAASYQITSQVKAPAPAPPPPPPPPSQAKAPASIPPPAPPPPLAPSEPELVQWE